MTSPTRTTETTNSGPRKSAGRPATGCDPVVRVRMPPDILAAIDRFAGKFAGLSRSQAIRALIDIGLHAGRKRNEDLVDYGCPDSRGGVDFLKETAAPATCECIVTNPPYSRNLVGKFVANAVALVPRVYMLVRLAFLESEGRSDILDGGRLARIYPFIQRLPMMHRAGWTGPRNKSAMGFAWCVWDRAHRGAPKVERIGFTKCKVCGEPFVARPDAVTCSSACRQRAFRRRHPKGRRRVTGKSPGAHHL
jgi:hypothetical protein